MAYLVRERSIDFILVLVNLMVFTFVEPNNAYFTKLYATNNTIYDVENQHCKAAFLSGCKSVVALR